jgi:hypothetical protein
VKEHRSACHQTAIKYMGSLVELVCGICPVVDQMTAGSRSKYSSEKFKEANSYLEKHEIIVSHSKSTNKMETESQEIDGNTIEHFGSQQLIVSWFHMLNDYDRQFAAWATKCSELFQRIDNSLDEPSLEPDHVAMLIQFEEEMKNLEASLLPSPPSDIEGYFACAESFRWIVELFQVNFTSSFC